MFYAIGTRLRTSTQAEATNPTTATLLAEISSLAAGNYEARVLFGASTLATGLIEHCLSTGLGSTALRDPSSDHLGRRTVYGPVNQTAQYILRFTAEASDRLRVRTSALTGTAAATIQLEQLS